jgi:hypothetical protein
LFPRGSLSFLPFSKPLFPFFAVRVEVREQSRCGADRPVGEFQQAIGFVDREIVFAQTFQEVIVRFVEFSACNTSNLEPGTLNPEP